MAEKTRFQRLAEQDPGLAKIGSEQKLIGLFGEKRALDALNVAERRIREKERPSVATAPRQAAPSRFKRLLNALTPQTKIERFKKDVELKNQGF